MTKSVRRAIRETKVLQLAYKDGTGAVTTRRVRPLAIWAYTDGWLFAGWCELRQDFLAFRMDRIFEIEETGDRFEDDPARNLQAYLSTMILTSNAHRRGMAKHIPS